MFGPIGTGIVYLLIANQKEGKKTKQNKKQVAKRFRFYSKGALLHTYPTLKMANWCCIIHYHPYRHPQMQTPNISSIRNPCVTNAVVSSPY